MSLLSARQEITRRDLESLRTNFGLLICARLDDPAVTDVMLNDDGTLYEDRAGAGMSMIGRMHSDDAMAVINLVASTAGEIVNRKNPVFEGELPIRGARFIAFVPPIVARPSFSIRLPATKVFSFDDYVAARIMTRKQADVIEDAIWQEQNILVSGGTKSGKTTLLNAVFLALSEIYPRKRVCLIEEIVELQVQQPNVLRLRTGANVDQQDLLRRLMRCRPDIIGFGEVRDKAAVQLMYAANTGHGAIISTTHANTPRSAPQRIEDLSAAALPPGDSLRRQVAASLGIIVGMSRIDPADLKEGEPERRVTEIIKVEGVENGAYVFSDLA
jgi:type IV secretion system protein TrbB